MEVKTAIIPAAGFGSRFLPVVKNVPKEMLPIIDKPSIQFLVEECLEAGMEKIIIVVRKGNTLIKDYFSKPADDVRVLLEMQGKMDRYEAIQKVLEMGKKVVVVDQDPTLPYGNGSPLYTVKDMLNPNEAYLYFFGDDMVVPNNGVGAAKQILDFYKKYENDTDVVIAGEHVPRSEVYRYGTVKFKSYDEVDKSGIMDYQVEKPNDEEFEKHQLSTVATYGRMVVTPRIFEFLTPTSTGKDNELWMADAVAKVTQVSNVRVKILDGKWVTTGDPERFLEAMIYYYLKHDKFGAKTKEFLKSLPL